MTDVRSMLRAERAARGTQPSRNAIPQRKSAVPASEVASKKRKAGDDQRQERKRTKAEKLNDLPAGFLDNSGDSVVVETRDTLPQEVEDAPSVTKPPMRESNTAVEAVDAPTSLPSGFFDNNNPSQKPAPTVAVDEDEWAAFEREVATPPPPERTTIAALNAAATIQAAPMSAAELAAQAREEQSTQRGRKDVEIEAEKEDAARHLEEEFDQMEELEERVRKLREKREALRQGRQEDPPTVVMDDAAAVAEQDPGEESDDEFDGDDWDDWRFRAA